MPIVSLFVKLTEVKHGCSRLLKLLEKTHQGFVEQQLSLSRTSNRLIGSVEEDRHDNFAGGRSGQENFKV